ncbi:TolC family protein [Bdellovibrionota bacterium FG-1]
MKSLIFTLMIILVSFCSTLGYASRGPFTLNAAVRFALENSPAFDTAQKTEAVRELEYRSAITKLLPAVDFSATHGLQNNISISGDNTLLTPNPASPWYSSLGLGMSATLYDNGVSLTNLKITGLNRDLAAVSTLKARDSLILSVVAEFYRYSLDTSLREVKKQQQALLYKQFQTLSSQYQQGFKTKSDFLRLKTQVQQAEIDQMNAQNNIERSAAELRKLIGIGFRETALSDFEPVTVRRERQIEAKIPVKAPVFEVIYEYRISKI